MSPIISRMLAPAAIVIALLCQISSVNAADSPAAHPRAALIIGNASYSAVNPLKNTANDAHDMCDALTELGYTVACFTDVKDSREFKARIQDFTAALKPRSEVVFYYAGHAIQVKGENYLVPINARLRAEIDVPKETVSLNYIMAQLLQAKHFLNIVILDACRSNPWGENSHGMTAGLAPITAIPRGTMVMYGTAANDVSDDGEGRNGTLTKNLLANIKLPGLTADEFFKRVSEGVQNDSAAAVGHTQTPALYTSFTGEFCFAGCIDKVARAELERIQKANEEQLAQMRKEKEEAEARNRATEAKLASTVTSMNCDKGVLNDSGQCFTAPADSTIKAVAATFMQRGFIISEGGAAMGRVEGVYSVENPKDKTLTDILTATATVREVSLTGHTVVTITANQRTVLHDEYRKWGSMGGLIPVPTSKEYKDVVKKDVNITDAEFYRDLFTAIERNLRADNASTAPTASTTAASTTTESSDAATSVAPTADSPAADSSSARAVPVSLQSAPPVIWGASNSVTPGHEHRYDAPPDQTQHALIEALVTKGYIIDSVNPDFGLINLSHKAQDPKDEHFSTTTTISTAVTAGTGGNDSQLQMSANQVRTNHRKPGSRVMGAMMGYQPHDYETVVAHEGAVTDAGFYKDLFAAIDATLHESAVTPSPHALHVTASVETSLLAAADGLAAQGFNVVRSDPKLGFVVAARRKQTQRKDGWTATYVHTTIYVRPVSATDSVLLASAITEESLRRVTAAYAMSGRRSRSMSATPANALADCQANACSPQEIMMAAMAAAMTTTPDFETVIQEGEAEPGVYKEILTAINPAVGTN